MHSWCILTALLRLHFTTHHLRLKRILKANRTNSKILFKNILNRNHLHTFCPIKSRDIFKASPTHHKLSPISVTTRLLIGLPNKARTASDSLPNAYTAPHTHRRQLHRHPAVTSIVLLRVGNDDEARAKAVVAHAIVSSEPIAGAGDAGKLSASLLPPRSTASCIQPTTLAAAGHAHTFTAAGSGTDTPCGSSASLQFTGTVCARLRTNASANRTGICSTSRCFDEPLDSKRCDLSAAHASPRLPRLSATSIGSTQWHGPA